MTDKKNIVEFIRLLKKAMVKEQLVSLNITNKRNKEDDLQSIKGKLVKLKAGNQCSLVYKKTTQDFTENVALEGIDELMDKLLTKQFYQGEFSTPDYTYYLTIFPNEKSKLRHKTNEKSLEIDMAHDHKKSRLIPTENNLYLYRLGIITGSFQVRSKAQAKYKQINKYVEIIDDILKRTKLPAEPTIVDMGSGKGYLTFGLYDYFTRIRKESPRIYGVEMRGELVDKCNEIAKECNFEHLQFREGMIQNVNFPSIDFLLALHACDTATDDAIHKGITCKAQLIVCAPCCHKQVRKRMNTEGLLENITKHGIMKERQAELLTDTLRAMILEAWGYKTRIFEFISTSHTPKNILIVASLDEARIEADPIIMKQVEQLRETFGIGYHYLEKILTTGTLNQQ